MTNSAQKVTLTGVNDSPADAAGYLALLDVAKALAIAYGSAP